MLDLQTNSQDGARVDEFSRIAHSFGAEIRGVINEPYSAHLVQIPRINDFLRESVGTNDWALLADADEFIEFPTKLNEFLKIADRRSQNLLLGTMIDRLSLSPAFPVVSNDRSLDDTFPFAYPLTRQIRRGWDRKIVAIRGSAVRALGGQLLHEGRHALATSRDYAAAEREVRMDKLVDLIPSRWIGGAMRAMLPRRGVISDGVRPRGGRLRVHHFAWDSLLREKMETRLRVDSGGTYPLELRKVLKFINAASPREHLRPWLLRRISVGA